MTVLQVLAILLANVVLCFSMKRHQRLLLSAPIPQAWERGARLAAFTVLFLVAWGFVAREGGVIGSAIFLGWFTVFQMGVAGVVTMLSRRRSSK